MNSSYLFSGLTLAALILGSAPSFAEKNPRLPPPLETPSVERRVTAIGWPQGVTPTAPQGYVVTEFASLRSPRSLYRLPNGDILVAQSSSKDSPNQITRLKMSGSDITGAEVFAANLKQPFGMAMWNNEFYVAEPDRILKFEVKSDGLQRNPSVVTSLPFPTPQRHWTRDLLLTPDGKKLYVSVGSASNVGEDGDPLDPRTAAILEMNRDGTDQRVFAGGIRNPVSMAWEPTTKALWAVVNERDELGDDLVPDYITRVIDGGFYGWPFAYWGPNQDPRQRGRRDDLVLRTRQPDFSVGAHTASLGIAFTKGTGIKGPYQEGALISQHGSWNSSELKGYKVIYVPFKNGKAEDGETDFLTGFIADESKDQVYGRPVASLVLGDGSVLVSDDAGGKIWKVSVVRPEIGDGGHFVRRPRIGDALPRARSLLPL
jgi:glucose/arabinose dehydrogenase